MKGRLVAAALAFASISVAAEDAPVWLKDLARSSVPQYDRKVSVVVLLNEENTVVGDAGKLITTTRTAIKFLARQGIDPMFYEQYDTGSGRVHDFRAWMIAPSGKIKKYGKEEIIDVACAANDVYNECRRRMVSGKRDAEVGAVFGYEATVERKAFSSQLLFTYQDSSPVRMARFAITAPPGVELKAESFNGAPKEAVPAGGVYTWQMENLPAIEMEPASPSLLSIVPWTGVNLLGMQRPVVSWMEAAKLLRELNEGLAEPDEAIALKARALVAGAATELDKIRAIGRFTQQINYVSIQVNIVKGGGYRPHAAADVFRKLYGDCKDKANLTRAMLKAVGITAYPVAIYSGDRTHVREEWPSLGAFNHAISAIRVGAATNAPAVLEDPQMGRLLFFDSTDPYVPVGYLPDHEQASLALVGAEDVRGLVRVPARHPEASSRKRSVEAVLGADGSIQGSFTDERSGDAVPRAAASFRAQPKADYVKMIERWVSRGVPGAATTAVEVADQSEAFVTKGKFTSQRYAQMPQSRMLIFRAAPLRYAEGARLTEKTRRYPVVLETDAFEESVRIAIPADFHVDEVPGPVRLDSPYGKYEASWKAENGTVVFQRKLEVQAQSVPADRYKELREFLDAVNGAAESPIVLVR
jgi:hypothetical protein